MVKQYLQFIRGQQSTVSPFLVGDDDLTLMNNVNTSYKLGACLKRLGYSKVGGVLDAKPITGLHNFRQSKTVQKILATCNNAAGTNLTLQYNNAGTWEDIVLGGAWDEKEDCKVEMEDFLGYCFFVGYDATDQVFLPKGTLHGIDFSTTERCTNMPQGKYIKRYRDRLYVANIYDGGQKSYRVGYSNVPSGTTLSWSQYEANTADFDVDYSEPITGLGQNWDKLFIFTEYSAYMYDQNTKKKVWDIGCIEHRTIKNLGAHMIWVNRDGVWDSTSGRPMNIAGRILDFVKTAVATGNTIFAEVIDDEYHLYLGDVTVNGIDYFNCSEIYNLATQSWRTAEYHDNFTIFARYNNDGDDRLYMGATDGEVHEMTKYYDGTPVFSDDNNDISAYFATKAFDFGSPEIEKDIQKIIAYADRAQGLNLKAKIIDTNTPATNKVVPLGQLTKYINKFTPKVKGNFLQIVGSETGQLPYFSFFGFTIQVKANEKL